MKFGRNPGKAKAASASTGRFFSRRKLIVTAGVLTLATVVAAAAVFGKNSPIHDRVQAATDAFTVHLAQLTGFTVSEILVVGRQETPRDALVNALDVDFGDPIFAVDLQAAREQMLALPWVSSVAVERVLPDTVVVHLTERRPMAVWQHNKQYAVIDREGHVLDRDSVSAFPNLLVVSGEDAPVHAAALIDMLRSEPQLMERVDAAMRVGGRRWNVFLDNGVSIRLPEEEPAEAWHRLAEYQRMYALLAKNIRAIDMRIPDKLILQAKGPQEPAPEAAAATNSANVKSQSGVAPRSAGSTNAGQAAGKPVRDKASPSKPVQGKATPDHGDAGKTAPGKTAASNGGAGKIRPGKTAPDKATEGKVTARGHAEG